ncbi:MAG TPA: hypothetical protein VIY86_02150 [Pirellulaceae bacterium]
METKAESKSVNRTRSSDSRNKEAAAALEPVHDLMDYVRDYTRERPGVVALWCLGVGFILGWKLKPW